MKLPSALLPIALLVALAFGSCTSVTEVAPDEQSSIRGFSRDTVWPGAIVQVFGKNLAFGKIWLGDLPLVAFDTIFSNFTDFVVPKNAATDYVYISTDGSFKARSPKRLIVIAQDTSGSGGHDTSGTGGHDTSSTSGGSFHLKGVSSDTAFLGEVLTIYGTGLLQKRDSLSIELGGVFIPIEMYTDDSIVFRLPTVAISSELDVIGPNRVYATYWLTAAKRIAWKHATISFVGIEYTAIHRRTGTVDHGRQIDSTWSEHALLNWSQSVDIPPSAAISYQGMCDLKIYWQSSFGPSTQSMAELMWADTSISTRFTIAGHSSVSNSATVTIDTMWSFTTYEPRYSINPSGPAAYTVAFVTINNPAISYQRRETSHDGDHDWIETSYSTASPSYGVGRISVALTP
jgi:hypothetical protein